MKGSKPLVALNADFRAAKKDAPAFTYLCSGYYDAIVKAGGIPLILPPLADEDDLARLLDLVDGVVLVGGADLDPRRDGFMLHPTVRPLE
jgi:putative glutamine amidotransferase